jgi:DNA-binding GntR family transcriptional regulator
MTKVKITSKDIDKLIKEEVNNFSSLEKVIGSEPSDRVIDYGDDVKKNATIDGSLTDDADSDMVHLKNPPKGLIEYLDILDQGLSKLSEVAASEKDENIKNRIYSHYEKLTKTKIEMIKEFGIAHN